MDNDHVAPISSAYSPSSPSEQAVSTGEVAPTSSSSQRSRDPSQKTSDTYDITVIKKPKQAISARKGALCQLCVLNFRVELKEENDTKVVLCQRNSEVKLLRSKL